MDRDLLAAYAAAAATKTQNSRYRVADREQQDQRLCEKDQLVTAAPLPAVKSNGTVRPRR
jgi:hypothetical protein